MFAHCITEVRRLRIAASRGGELHVRGDLRNEAPPPVAAQRSEPPRELKQPYGTVGAEQADGLGRPVERQERRHGPRPGDCGACHEPVPFRPRQYRGAELHEAVREARQKERCADPPP